MMDLNEAIRIMRLVRDDNSISGHAWDGQNESAKIVLAELERLQKENENLSQSFKDPRMTVEVSGGMVQNVYTTIQIGVDVDVLDFDGDGSDTDRDELREHLEQVIATQKQIY